MAALIRTLCSAFFLILIFGNRVNAEPNPLHTPMPGTTEWKEIQESVRKKLKITDKFKIYHFRIKNDYAYFVASSIDRVDGETVEFDSIKAVLKKDKDKLWKVVDAWSATREGGPGQQKAFKDRARAMLQAANAVDIFSEEP